MTIQEWIANPEDFSAGIALYEQYGSNQAYLNTLKKRGESEHMRADLVYELGKCIPAEVYNHVEEEAPELPEQSQEVAEPKKIFLMGRNRWMKLTSSPDSTQSGNSIIKKLRSFMPGSRR